MCHLKDFSKRLISLNIPFKLNTRTCGRGVQFAATCATIPRALIYNQKSIFIRYLNFTTKKERILYILGIFKAVYGIAYEDDAL